MSMEWTVKHWSALTREEVYDLLEIRTAVFVVEQHCPYQEADGLDRRAWHLFARDGAGRVAACLRILEPEADGTARMGRVLTAPSVRGSGLGLELLRRGIQAAWTQAGAGRILLHAQTYVRGFYERLGFQATPAPEFLEDGIPHVEMVLERGQR